ncbi:9875_t:CDS:2 [Ambispora gerdemannii]|uniref:9875_t:CDS:1 n=1 Tax=Ambispora gerdemannii TaxID=144530 RepID=A0A9N8VCH8_9GLOM|nr:9875_t:CDS:2 [Ambispora gerdemannii]
MENFAPSSKLPTKLGTRVTPHVVGSFKFPDRSMEALQQFRQLGLESLTLEEKKAKIVAFCTKYHSVQIPLDIGRHGYLRLFSARHSHYLDEWVLEEYNETLVLYVGS